MISDAHVAQYAAEGCVRVEGVFSAEWVARLLAAVDACAAVFARGEVPAAVMDGGTQNPPSIHFTGEGGVQLRNCVPAHADFVAWLADSPAAAVVGRLTGASSVRFWMDATFVKSGADPEAATPWHNDVCTFPFVGEQLPSFWVALTDVDADNAPMLTLAGSNRDAWRYHSPLSRQDMTLPGYRPWDELLARVAAPDADVRMWEAKAGDILLIHPRTIHASLPRKAGLPGRRVAFTTRWIGSDVVWAPDALSASIPRLSDHPAMRVGEAPPEGLFPVRWRS
ncbi:phytanoyl-CoA dioxygenase family protein [Sandaracinobacteroides saxicola]|uniref:Phytanoyl-CoA dioxygenase family protein n=1 Tax=Sandaracinobacteroides saxicola TaxID=2759707 RepID=A0A7G5IL84_9SPHN|nr:phytanoyl-CoA dioxygenase family protein [Sandaracinobacteroides saxicola]QMW24126.1 phytanoyl-CoA dioxygenase family protein [Sandaracinobacteroides saxicola]